MVLHEETKETMDHKKNALEADIAIIRSFHLNQIKRQSAMNDERLNLLKSNGGSSVQSSDIIKINVGGTKLKVARSILVLIKGSRLEALFSGRWENKLLRDDDGCVFMDLDITHFEKIVNYLCAVKECQDKEESVDRFPKLHDFSVDRDQAVFDAYVEFFRLQNDISGQSSAPDEQLRSPSKKENITLSHVELLDAFQNEKQELIDLTKKLDAMESELEEERHFVSFFTTNDAATLDKSQRSHSENTNNDTWFSVVGSNMMDSNDSSSTGKSSSESFHTIISNDHIVNLWIEGKVIPVKFSTLCHFKDSELARRFNDADWLRMHTFQSCYNGSIVVFLEHPIEAFESIINHLRLYAISESAGIISKYQMKGIHDPHDKKVLQETLTTLFGQVKDKFELQKYPRLSRIYKETMFKVNAIRPGANGGYDALLKKTSVVANALYILKQCVCSIIGHFFSHCSYIIGKLITGCKKLSNTVFVQKEKVYHYIGLFCKDHCGNIIGKSITGSQKFTNTVLVQKRKVYHYIGRFCKNRGNFFRESSPVQVLTTVMNLFMMIIIGMILSSSDYKANSFLNLTSSLCPAINATCHCNFTYNYTNVHGSILFGQNQTSPQKILPLDNPEEIPKTYNKPRSVIITKKIERAIIHDYLVQNYNQGYLLPGQKLQPEERVYSENGKYMLIYQSDCNLVLYDQNENPLWSKQGGKYYRCKTNEGYVHMSNDGELIIYDSYDGLGVSFSTKTNGNPGARLKIENSGNLRIIGPNSEELWWRNIEK